ncbi:hypothetical protein A7D23_03295 [Dehalobacter sp. TeCB1]|uniref:Uncharacterized protein n=1 Tax=Dehalobacter restrictus (strain DSM 9455 / PER-K23) TaxID=871738 RepID=A0ABN4C0J8_DEHRP|nr:hypothetical protein DEHRE_09610 [Dehalobacter restrictus DSM 9455]OCZ49495.1 hypothetical protein A7D23_03295 [Dehalobacter sp. TeCB1]
MRIFFSKIRTLLIISITKIIKTKVSTANRKNFWDVVKIKNSRLQLDNNADFFDQISTVKNTILKFQK